MEREQTKGRKRLYEPEKLEIGEKMKLKGKMKKFPYSYCQSFNLRGNEKYQVVKGPEKEIFLERIL